MRPIRVAWLALALAASPALAGEHSIRPRPVLPFIQDDYRRAIKQARARKLPLFIEAWAPW